MKKTMLTLALAATIGLAGFQLADARPGAGYGYGPGMGPGEWPNPNCLAIEGLDEEALQAREEFYQATQERRQEMAAKRAQLQAAINAGNENRAKVLSNELFELRTQMREQAQEAGIQRGGRGGGRDHGGRRSGPRS